MKLIDILTEATYHSEAFRIAYDITKDILNKKSGTIDILPYFKKVYKPYETSDKKTILVKKNKGENVSSPKDREKILESLSKLQKINFDFEIDKKFKSNIGGFSADTKTPKISIKSPSVEDLMTALNHEIIHLVDFLRRYPITKSFTSKGYDKYSRSSDVIEKSNRELKAGPNQEKKLQGLAPYFFSRPEFNVAITQFMDMYNRFSKDRELIGDKMVKKSEEDFKKDLEKKEKMVSSYRSILRWMSVPVTNEILKDKGLKKRVLERLHREGVKLPNSLGEF